MPLCVLVITRARVCMCARARAIQTRVPQGCFARTFRMFVPTIQYTLAPTPRTSAHPATACHPYSYLTRRISTISPIKIHIHAFAPCPNHMRTHPTRAVFPLQSLPHHPRHTPARHAWPHGPAADQYLKNLNSISRISHTSTVLLLLLALNRRFPVSFEQTFLLLVLLLVLLLLRLLHLCEPASTLSM